MEGAESTVLDHIRSKNRTGVDKLLQKEPFNAFTEGTNFPLIKTKILFFFHKR